MLLLAALLCLAAGTLLIGGQLYLTAKARLAERLIARAFAAQATEGSAAAPWPWADFRPLARLEVPRTGVCRYVLTGGSGTSMAFGIGHLDGTAKPNRPGNCVLVGHRDSWCRFLKALIPGDRFEVTTGAETRAYEMVAAEVVDHQDPAILDPIREGITLVTCYPFDSLRPGPLRYVVHCRPLGDRGQVASEGSSTACRHATLPAPKRALSDGTHVNGVPEGPRRARGSRCRDGW